MPAGGFVDICGQGRVPVDSDDPVAPYRIVGALARRTTGRWIAALQDSDDLRARASGLLLEGLISDGVTAQPISAKNRDELVQLATGSDDPAVYAIALWVCGKSTEGPDAACGRLSIERWASVDPDNAVPWLALAAEARGRGDAGAETTGYTDSLFGYAEPAIPPDATAVDRSFLAMEVIGVEAAMLLPYNIASKHCSAAAIADDGVKAQCNALAELLVGRGDTLFDVIAGGNLGARVGWPAQRVSALIQRRKALQQAIAQSTPSGNDDLWTCRGAQLLNGWMDRRHRLGEMGAAAEALERSGETEEAMAAKWDETMAAMRREAMKRIPEPSPP